MDESGGNTRLPWDSEIALVQSADNAPGMAYTGNDGNLHWVRPANLSAFNINWIAIEP
jgi:hypothetical protein